MLKVTLVRLVQFLNVLSQIYFTELGITILVKLVQFSKEPIEVKVTVEGIVIDFKFVQFLKELMELTFAGSWIDSKLVQPSKE